MTTSITESRSQTDADGLHDETIDSYSDHYDAIMYQQTSLATHLHSCSTSKRVLQLDLIQKLHATQADVHFCSGSALLNQTLEDYNS